VDPAAVVEPTFQVSTAMVISVAGVLVTGLWATVVSLGKANYKRDMDSIAGKAALNELAAVAEKAARESDIRELRGKLDALAARVQEEREEKIILKGNLAVVQGSLNQQADALERQTATLMTRLDQLDYRKQSRGLPAQDARIEREAPAPYTPGPMRPRMKTGQDFER
jgi:hypothetical protein